MKLSDTKEGRKDMVKIGDLCPLFFNPIKDNFGIECDYIQTFYTEDKILIQLFSDGEPPIMLYNLTKDFAIEDLDIKQYVHNDNVTMYYFVITGLEDGVYMLSVDGEESEPFCVTSDDGILETTSLIRYSHKDNNSVFDNIFWVGDERQVFEWRVEAGFKSSGYSPKVDSEQYRNQFQEITQLYSMPYDSYTLTVGNAGGVPYWFVRHLNRLFCVSDVTINGEGWIRSEGSVPEMTQVLEGMPSYHATMLLEPRKNAVSGIGGVSEKGTSSSVVGFSIVNPTDGQMLQYKEDKSAFVNVTTIES